MHNHVDIKIFWGISVSIQILARQGEYPERVVVFLPVKEGEFDIIDKRIINGSFSLYPNVPSLCF